MDPALVAESILHLGALKGVQFAPRVKSDLVHTAQGGFLPAIGPVLLRLGAAALGSAGASVIGKVVDKATSKFNFL